MTEDLLSTSRELLSLFRDGDKRALAEVWEWYFPMVKKLAVNGFGDFRGFSKPYDIDDAISATFIAAFEERSRLAYDGITPFSKYLYGIGRNVMRRMVHKQMREPIIEEVEYKGTVSQGNTTPEESFVSHEQQLLLSRFPDQLSEVERAVFDGYYKSGLSEEALAKGLGMTRHRVRKHLKRVSFKMKRFVRELGLSQA